MTKVGARIEIPPIIVNFSPFALIFTAKKYLDGARTMIAAEASADGGWHPVGKFRLLIASSYR